VLAFVVKVVLAELAAAGTQFWAERCPFLWTSLDDSVTVLLEFLGLSWKAEWV
jgi:hypothetical protein